MKAQPVMGVRKLWICVAIPVPNLESWSANVHLGKPCKVRIMFLFLTVHSNMGLSAITLLS